MISRVGLLSALLPAAVLTTSVSAAATYRQGVDVRNTVAEFESALRKGDIALMRKLVTRFRRPRQGRNRELARIVAAPRCPICRGLSSRTQQVRTSGSEL